MTTPDPTPPAVSPDADVVGEIRISPDGEWLAWKRRGLKAWAILSTEVSVLGLVASSQLVLDQDVTDWTPLVPAVSPVDTAALREQVARAMHNASVNDGWEFDAPWDERSQKVHLRWLSRADAALSVVAPLLSASAHREGQAVVRQKVLRADLGKAERDLESIRREVDRLTASPDPAVHPSPRNLVDLWARLNDEERLNLAARMLDAQENARQLPEMTADRDGWRYKAEARQEALERARQSAFEDALVCQALRAELARVTSAEAVEKVAQRMLRIKLYGVALDDRYDEKARTQWTDQLTDEERADWLRDARALLVGLRIASATASALDPVADKIAELIEQAHENRRIGWKENRGDEYSRHWGAVAGWLRHQLPHGHPLAFKRPRPVEDDSPSDTQASAEPTPASKLFDRLIAGARVVNGVPRVAVDNRPSCPSEGDTDRHAGPHVCDLWQGHQDEEGYEQHQCGCGDRWLPGTQSVASNTQAACICTTDCPEERSENPCPVCRTLDAYAPCPIVGFGCGPGCDCCTPEQQAAADPNRHVRSSPSHMRGEVPRA